MILHFLMVETEMYYYVFTHGSTFVIPVLKNLDIVMVEQHRYLNGKISIEFPGGGQGC